MDWQARAEALQQELDQLVYAISHDLREPVRKVGGFTKILLRRLPPLAEEDAKYAAYIEDACQRLDLMMQALLQLSRIGRRERAGARLDANATVAGLWRELAPAAATLHADALPAVQGDRELWQRLWRELLQNAVTFRDPERPLRVEVRAAAPAHGMVRFEVADNGIGMAPDRQERDFELFQTGHGRGHYPGVGAGLAIARRIVSHHGGSMGVSGSTGVTSGPNPGATLFFTWPALDGAA